MEVWWFSVCVFTTLMFSFIASLPTTVAPKFTETTPSIPLEFPKFSQNYTFVENSSIRENLASHSEIDAEVPDLLKIEEDIEPAPSEEETESEIKNQKNVTVNFLGQDDTGKKNVVEWIENGDDTEDEKYGTVETVNDGNTRIYEEKTTEIINKGSDEETTVTTEETTTKKLEVLEPYRDGVPLIGGSVAAILVATFLVICIFGYTALIIWRRSLEQKYGSREMLVDKDIFDPEDMKHFSI